MSTDSPDDPRLTEARNPRTARIDRAGTREVVDLIQAEDRTVPDAVAAEAEAVADVVDDVAPRLRRGGRLFYVGAGTSGRLGVLDAAECPPTFGTEPELVQGIIAGGREALVRSKEGAEDDRGAGRSAVRDAGVGERDFVLGIATSGTTPFVHAALEEADDRGAGTGFLSCTPPPEAARRAADHLVTPLVGPEVVAGSTRMKAGTATKLVLNTLSTAVMIRLGKVYGNLMVDLRAVSRKLVHRSVRIVRRVTGADEATAREALVGAGGSAKTAIAMLELDVGRAVAERALDAAGDVLGRALDRWGEADRVPYYGCYGTDFGADDAGRLRERLREGPDAVERALERAREKRREGRAVGTGALGGWSAAGHVAHLVECEEPAFRSRARAMLDAGAGERPRFPDFEPSDPPPGAAGDPGRLLARFREERKRTLEALEGIAGDGWHREGVVDGEAVALHQLLRGAAHHDRAHADRIAQWIHPALLEPKEAGAPEDGGAAGGPPEGTARDRAADEGGGEA